ncbi:response regulator transcription factor [Rubripirellula amarantea]|nr:response regulator transcription factor [Rubripirellula amarantea]
MTISIHHVDSRALMRAGIRTFCDQHPDLELVEQASSLNQGLEQLSTVLADVLVLDVSLVGGDWQSLATRLQQVSQESTGRAVSNILAISPNQSAEEAALVTSLGARGYIACDATLDELAMAIRCVAAGRIFITHSGSARPAPHFAIQGSKNQAERDESNVAIGDSIEVGLSEREREVLTLLLDGMTNKQAAAKLFLSVKTVETYRSRIMKKHGLKNRMELIRFAKDVVDMKQMSA